MAALAPALLVLVYLPAQVMLRCRIDGLLRTECCCPHHQQEQPPSGPAIEAQDCCEQEIANGQRPQAEVAPSSSRDLVPVVDLALLAPFPPLASPPIGRFDRTAQRHGPAREGPRLVLLKHAFLI